MTSDVDVLAVTREVLDTRNVDFAPDHGLVIVRVEETLTYLPVCAAHLHIDASDISMIEAAQLQEAATNDRSLQRRADDENPRSERYTRPSRRPQGQNYLQNSGYAFD